MNLIEHDEENPSSNAPGGQSMHAQNDQAQQPTSSRRKQPMRLLGEFLGLQRPSADPSAGQRENTGEQTTPSDSAAPAGSSPQTSTGRADPGNVDRSPLGSHSKVADDVDAPGSDVHAARLRLVSKQRVDDSDTSWSFIKTEEPDSRSHDLDDEAQPPAPPVRTSENEKDIGASASLPNELAGKLRKMLSDRYLIANDKYFFRDREQILAFEDGGKRIATVHDAPEVAHSMIDLAQAKGWTGIKLKGSDEFKREAWLAATLRGMEVRGYRPKENDKARLADILAARDADKPNAIEKIAERGDRDHVDARAADNAKRAAVGTTAPQQSHLGKGHRQQVEMLKRLLRDRGDSEKAVEMTAALASEQLLTNRSYVGKLLDHGAAPYEHKPNEQDSYFVVIDTPRGEKTVWGVDLERAVEENHVERGTDIVLSHIGRKNVTVPKSELTDNGQHTGRKVWTDAQRNDWEIMTVDEVRDLAAARAVSASHDRQTQQQEPVRPPPQMERQPQEQQRQRAPDRKSREPDHPIR